MWPTNWVHKSTVFTVYDLPQSATWCLSRQKCASSGTIDRTAPDSHVNCRYLTTPEKCDRLKRLHQLQRSTRLRTDRVKRKLTHIIEKNSVSLDDGTHNDIKEIMVDSTPHIANWFPKNSFKHLFWEQQRKALQVKDSKSIKWHPLMIKWCLYLRHHSGKAYEHSVNLARSDFHPNAPWGTTPTVWFLLLVFHLLSIVI